MVLQFKRLEGLADPCILFELTYLTVVSIEFCSARAVIATRISNTSRLIKAWRAGAVVNYKAIGENLLSEKRFNTATAHIIISQIPHIGYTLFNSTLSPSSESQGLH